ncbi:hypothetical protein DFH07DRAFT_747799 [Mycena maculata]|uniref:C2H2-type domain-containing protein n=1 Tax=Mycena maculata TaxID=230809 RepID=A0AAD7N693_9AGAR|nr:hypothetical protein DFH07DRAFT_747799 [Mycena maculata]
MADAEDGADGEEGVAEEGKKHVCLTCSKRFNRPSSLRIHVNTHTGATPFRCPHPNCGRAFNVNSNMRRHFRNHGTPGYGDGPSPLSLPPHPSSSYPFSPTSPQSATWSVSSGASYSPTTPSSAYSVELAFSPAPSPPQSASLSPLSTWSPVTSVQKGYSESDVRSERR